MIYCPDYIETSFFEMPAGEPFVCCYSGGKDSAIALSMACEKGALRGLLHWTDDNNNSVFHAQNMELIKKQAECMRIPLIAVNYSLFKNRSQLLNTYKALVNKGVKSIIFGDIYLEDSVKLQAILCKKAGLIPRYPLWKKTYAELIKEIKKRKIKSIITRVNTAKISEEWLGKAFDESTYQKLCSLEIDPFGEKGEFHTTVIDSDIFVEPLFLSLESKNSVNLELTSHCLHNNMYKIFTPNKEKKGKC